MIEVEHPSALEHRRGERLGLLVVHAAEEHGHGERGDLVVGDLARRVARHEVAPLGRRERAAVALPFDQLHDRH
jgi:hypothetical protein